jgi:hypothetical protein
MNSLVNRVGDLSSLSLHQITAESTLVVDMINKKRNNKRSPSIWSPIAHLLNLRVSALGSTVRAGLKNNPQSLLPIVSQLRYDESKISLNEDECAWLNDNDIDTDPFDWHDWKNRYSSTSSAARELLRLKKLLSQENRKEFRRIHSDRMSRVQEEADAGRIGSVLKDIMGGSSAFTMESIRNNGIVETDGESISKLITSFFAKWFARLPEQKLRDKRLADCVLSQTKLDWDSLIHDCNIPTEVSDKLWDAFKPRAISAEGAVEAAALSNYLPSLQDFKGYNKSLNPRSAPGFSGLSYLMVQLWPEMVVERAYDCLLEAWKRKEGLEGWGTRFLAPIPKKNNPDLKDLRPLMLVEVMRKIWVGLITGRVTSFLLKHNLINP